MINGLNQVILTYKLQTPMEKDQELPNIEPSKEVVKLEQVENQKPKIKKIINSIPEQYYQNQLLNKTIQVLPSHYNFQIYKTLHRIDTLAEQQNKTHLKVSLQFPEGLMLYACIITDILTTFSKPNIQIIIMGDVTYGACCVDDIASDQMGCDLLVHYGHSCLIPITQTRKKILYVFVEIQIDIQHFVDSVEFNFQELKGSVLYLLGTIQFNNSLYLGKQKLAQKGFSNILIPQEKPRSGGQVLGCTSPKLPLEQGRNIVIFLCDGRFHMQATMIANPKFQFYQYDPYTRLLTEQKYATDIMIQRRSEQIEKAENGKDRKICFILGTLGRQGNPQILDRLIQKIKGKYQYMILMASQINTDLLNIIPVDFYVQIACPRLSIDWAYGTPKPLLTPYQLFVLMDKINIKQSYSMDFYSHNGGPWSNFYGKIPQKGVKKLTKAPKIKLQMQE